MGSELAKEETKSAGPWSRLHDSPSPLSRVPGALRVAKNLYRDVSDPGRPMVGRQGRTRIGTSLGGAGRVQVISDWGKKDGSRFTAAVIAGEIYSLNWSTLVWTRVVNAGDLAAVAITLSTFRRVSCLSFANTLVLSDGLNVPFTWDGSAGAGGLTKLTNCPALYGPPTQHYGRLFGIKDSDRLTAVWSEVLQPNVGYEAAGFANAWTVGQTDPAPLKLLVGSNDGLYAFRERSCTLLIGRPDLNFSSSATRDSIDQSIGTSSPWGAVETSRGVFVLDSDYRAHQFRAGSSAEPSWEGFSETLKSVPYYFAGVDARERVLAVMDPVSNVYIFGVPDGTETNTSAVSKFLIYDAEGELPVPIAIWTGWPNTTALTLAEDRSTADAHNLQLRLLSGDMFGNIYLHGLPSAPVLNDDSSFFSGTIQYQTAAIQHSIRTQVLAFDLKRKWWFNRIDYEFGVSNGSCNILYETPAGEGLFSTVTPGTGIVDKHFGVGIEDEGRWIRVGVDHGVLNQGFSLYAASVTAVQGEVDT